MLKRSDSRSVGHSATSPSCTMPPANMQSRRRVRATLLRRTAYDDSTRPERSHPSMFAPMIGGPLELQADDALAGQDQIRELHWFVVVHGLILSRSTHPVASDICRMPENQSDLPDRSPSRQPLTSPI